MGPRAATLRAAMYEYLRGEVAARGEGAAVVEVIGVAYRLVCSASTLRKVPPKGPCRLFTHLIVREERLDLFGFADEAERHLFRQLLQVTGVGPAAAIALLSAYEPVVARVAHRVRRGRSARTGEGHREKTAERILVELRDRLRKGEGPGKPPAPWACAATPSSRSARSGSSARRPSARGGGQGRRSPARGVACASRCGRAPEPPSSVPPPLPALGTLPSVQEPAVVPIRDLKAHEEGAVRVQGWLLTRRSGKKLHFLQVRDGTGDRAGRGRVEDAGARGVRAGRRAGQEASLIVTGERAARTRARRAATRSRSPRELRSTTSADYPIGKQ